LHILETARYNIGDLTGGLSGMRVLADFLLDSDLCLVSGQSTLTLRDPDSDITLTLSNAEHDPATPNSVLSAQLVFDAPSFDYSLRSLAEKTISGYLNVLSFTTNRKFSVVFLKRIIDWTPGTIDRQAFIFVETPEWDEAEAGLDQRFVETAQRLLAMSISPQQRQAMRWYRRGIEANNVDAQFSYFWFALEIAAEQLKGSERVPSKCPKCGGPLYCEGCQDHPVHRRYPGEAINRLVERVHPQDAEEVFRTLQTIRHTLMHYIWYGYLYENRPLRQKSFSASRNWGLRYGRWPRRPRGRLGASKVRRLLRPRKRTLIRASSMSAFAKTGSHRQQWLHIMLIREARLYEMRLPFYRPSPCRV
jgi:hypothetical protein